jgi:uroporphyrinogen decarboxylase
MNKRERVFQILRHQTADICPYHIRCTKPALAKLVQATGDTDIMEHIGNHIAYMPCRAADEEVEFKPGFIRDKFGVIWNRTIDKDIGVVESYQVIPQNVDDFPFPDPLDSARFNYVKDGCQKHPDLFKLATKRLSLFERAWSLRGMENFLMDMAADQDFVDALLDRITAFNMAIVEEALKYPIDGFHIGDDWGQQKGLIMGPKYWRRFIKPRLAVLFARAKREGKFVSIHSCGDIWEILPDLIEIGLDMYNPFQPESIDVYKAKKEFGHKLTFWGGISTQKTLPFGTPDDVRREVREKIKSIGENGGYVCAPAHDIQGDVPIENIQALLEALQNQ